MLRTLLGLIVLTATSLAFAHIEIQNTEGQPVVGAEVMIGPAPDVPFAGNIVTTDTNGVVAIPKVWRDALPLTISADNYIRTTIPSVTPTHALFIINHEDGSERFEIKGDTVDYGRLRKDGKIDFSLVIPALERNQLLNFDISTVISPEMDTIKVITKTLSVPSNLSLPKQTETYILPVTIDKPGYRMYVRQPGQYRMTGIHGQFPLKRVINDIQNGKSYFEIINHFKFKGGGQRDVNISGNTTGQDVSIKQMRFGSSVNALGPQTPEGMVAVGMAMVNQNGLLFPSDLKRLTPGQTMALKTPAGVETYIMSLLSEDRDFPGFRIDSAVNGSPEDEENLLNMLDFEVMSENPEILGGLSFVLQQTPVSKAPAFLNLIPEPEVDGNTVRFETPAGVEGVTPLATLIILSEVDQGTTAEPRAEVRTRLWEFQSEGWIDSITLPEVALELDPQKTHQWEVLFLGTTEKEIAENPLDSVTHLTRNSIEF